jgi:hypothetical protein
MVCSYGSCAQLCNAALMLFMLILTGIAIGITYPAIKKDMKDNPASGYILWILTAVTLVMFLFTFRTLYR